MQAFFSKIERKNQQLVDEVKKKGAGIIVGSLAQPPCAAACHLKGECNKMLPSNNNNNVQKH